MISPSGPCPETRSSCGLPAPTVQAARRVGEPAPEIRLPDLEGKNVCLEDFKGEETLLIFWNPGCGFCQRVLPDLKAWEADRPEEAPKLLVVSVGTKDAIEAMNFRSPVVLDQGFSAGRVFGASGTPSAVLLDAGGRIASEVAVGPRAVLALCGGL